MAMDDVHRRAGRSAARTTCGPKLVPKSDGPDKLWRLNRRQTAADTGYVTDTVAVLAQSKLDML